MAVGRRIFVVCFVERAEDAAKIGGIGEIFVHQRRHPSLHRYKGSNADERRAGKASIDQFAGQKPLGVGIAAVGELRHP